jgi:hypothetical protein
VDRQEEKYKLVKRILIFAILSVLLLAAPVFAQDPGNGIIEGQVNNGTAGGDSAGGIQVTLEPFKDGVAQTPVVTLADAGGVFVFSRLATEPAYSYQAKASFQGVEYTSEPVTFTANVTSVSAEITVFNTTEHDGNISIALAHTILYPENGSVLVKEYYLLTNAGDRTFPGPIQGTDNGTLLFTLPPGAADLQVTFGRMENFGGNSIMDTTPVKPGMHEVAYQYRLNQGIAGLAFTQKINYGAARFDFLVQGENYKVAGEQLTPDEPLNIGGVMYTHYSAAELPPGASLSMQVSGADSSSDAGSLWMFIIGAVVLIIVVIAFVYLYRKKKEAPVAGKGDLEKRQARLLEDLAELDDRFEDGSIKEDYYQKLRDEKKAELAELIRKLKGE